MKNKILLEISIPATGQRLEMRVSKRLQIAKMEEMLSAYLDGKNGDYLSSGGVLLCEPTTGKRYERNAELSEIVTADGMQMLLM